jgi:DNA mismatch repair protein MutH
VPSLGIEVKTLPVEPWEGQGGRVCESTWVCFASPEAIAQETWSSSRVRKKLARVLFVPVEGGAVPVEARRVGTAFLWSPDEEEDAILRRDWEDLADLVAHGLGFAVSARRGRALQLRPKARDASVRRTARSADGETYEDAPQGFYLRRAFTQRIVDRIFAPMR